MPKLPSQNPNQEHSKKLKSEKTLTEEELLKSQGGKFLKGYKEKRKKASG